MVFNEYVQIREEKFGAVIFETLKEKVFVTNATGRDILNFLKEGKTTEEIISALAGLYAANPTEIKDDLLAFVGLLKGSALLEVK